MTIVITKPHSGNIEQRLGCCDDPAISSDQLPNDRSIFGDHGPQFMAPYVLLRRIKLCLWISKLDQKVIFCTLDSVLESVSCLICQMWRLIFVRMHNLENNLNANEGASLFVFRIRVSLGNLTDF